MSAIRLFSTHKVRIDGGTVMLASGDIDSGFVRQLSSYIKQDQSLCHYLHVFHHQLTPNIDRGVVRTWYVDGKLVVIKDWLIDDHSRLVDYPLKATNPDPEVISADLINITNLSLNGLHTPQSYMSSNLSTKVNSPEPNTDVWDPLNSEQQSLQVEDLAEHMDETADGTVDRFLAKRDADTDKRDTMAVFVHAGAGYHSFLNERIHLSICSEAASHAMRCLKAGGSSTNAVAVALKLLEDNDITNAGIGSNLTVDGRVECDATIVDHFGRSGACGAVPNIKNPILLAKLILDTSLNSLTLRRVPPNMLIGEGAKNFAAEHGMVIASNKDLVSKNAADRYNKWCEDLQKAEDRANGLKSQKSTGQITPPDEASRMTSRLVASTAHLGRHVMASQGLRDHSSAVLTGMWNEGQPDSPSAEPASPSGFDPDPATPTKRSPLSASQNGPQTPKHHRGGFNAARSQVRAYVSSDESAEQLPAKRRKTSEDKPVSRMDGVKEDMDTHLGWVGKVQASQWIAGLEYPEVNNKIDATELTAEPAGVDPDLITDTIGVIAIDGQGNIAAGSSSGGIGMKHSGRVGPAALVGIGTSVIPRDEADEDERTVATVTSGTGEHMATTMAAHKCAERLYHMTSGARGRGGDNVDVCSEGEVMENFVVEDFMGHPGVRNQTSARAIGVLAVKMTAGGIYMHWAHNTDSFALAHMASYHQEPKCVMSRLVPGSKVNVGAIKICKNHAQAKKYRAK